MARRLKLDLDLRHASRWVWVLVFLAAAWFVLSLIAAPSIDASVAYTAFIGAVPALFAASLMYVAPGERLVRIAAFAFALPVAVNASLAACILLTANVLGQNYLYLAQRIAGAASTFRFVSWIFPIVAVTTIALYIGPVRTRTAWILIAAGITLALLQTAAIFGSLPPGLGLDQVFVGILSQTVWIAWAFLLSAAVGHRMLILALAAAANLLSGLFTFLTLGLVQSGASDPNSSLAQGLLVVLWALGLVSWAALIVGIVRELPRAGQETEADSVTPQRALSVGR